MRNIETIITKKFLKFLFNIWNIKNTNKTKFKYAPLSSPQKIAILDNKPIHTRLVKVDFLFIIFQIKIRNKTIGISRYTIIGS